MIRKRERVARIGSWLILLLVLLPAVTYMGHWPLAAAAAPIDAHDSSEVDEHEPHCHGGVSHCAGGEAMVGSTCVGEEPGLLFLNSPHLHIETHEETAALEGEPSRVLQPPQTV